MKQGWLAFLSAVQFLTLIPVRFAEMPDSRVQANGLLCYPLVGGLIGLVLLLLALLLQGLPAGLVAALVLTVWAGISGGLHLDGLADSADGWLGGLGNRERTLEIMKDPHVGASGVLVLILVLLLKWSALTALLEVGQFWPLLAAPLAGRSAALLLLATTPYARPNGIAEGMLTGLKRRHARVVCAVVLLGLAGLNPLLPLILLLAGVGLRRLMLQRLGGTTGDTAGATIELIEALFLIVIIIIQTGSH